VRHRLAEQLLAAEADADALLKRVEPGLGVGVEGRCRLGSDRVRSRGGDGGLV
jgi:hypothetical protein